MATLEELMENTKQQDLERFKLKLDIMEAERDKTHIKEGTEGIDKIMDRRIKAMTPEPPGLTDLTIEETENVIVTHGRDMPKKDIPADVVKLKPPTEDGEGELFKRFLETIKGN